MKNQFKIIIMLLISIPLAIGITGCSGGGVNGEGKGSYDTGTPIVRGNVYTDTGWEYLSKGQYDSAIKYFNDVLSESPTESEKAEAYNGIGWAKAFNGKLKDGMKYFQLAADLCDDAKVGLGAAYIQQASLSDLEEAIQILYVQLGKSKPRFNYVPVRATGVVVENDKILSSVWVQGEISNLVKAASGHCYFTLKDDNSRLSAVMFQSSAQYLKFTPEDGMNVLVEGRISCYPAQGTYQIYVDKMEMDGLGNLYLEYEKLKKKLAAEGLFSDLYKKPIPKYPSKIGIVTASTGAAIKDILSTIKRRYPICETILFPSLVQGSGAAPDIVKQISKAQEYDLDVLIVGRGGGSIEDLWAFNEEIVANAIYESRIPIISAVGHEIDFTIADFVADLRAPTPTGAAEMAVPQLSDMINLLKQISIRLNNTIINQIKHDKRKLEDIINRNIFKNPITIYQTKEIIFDNLIEKLKFNLINLTNIKEKELIRFKNSYVLQKPYQMLDKKSNKYLQLVSKLETLSPLLTLKRGYTITKINDKVISSSKKIKKGEVINIEFTDGNINAEVL